MSVHKRLAADGNDKQHYVPSKLLGTGSEDRDASPLLSTLVGAGNVGSLGQREVAGIEFYSCRDNGRWGDAAGLVRRGRLDTR